MKAQIVVTMSRKEVDDAIHEAAKKCNPNNIGGVEISLLYGEDASDVVGAAESFHVRPLELIYLPSLEPAKLTSDQPLFEDPEGWADEDD